MKTLEDPLTAVRHGKDSAEQYGTILDRVVSELQDLNRGTEQEFLEIGRKLVQFLGVARQVSAGMAALAELISGNYVRHASEVLTRVLERSQRTEARAEQGDRVLAEVCQSIDRMERTLRGFERTVAVFRALGFLTRIETARLGHEAVEFGKLADDVNALRQRIEASGRGILEASSILQGDMRSALNSIASLRASELKELPGLIADVMTSLESLQDQQQRAQEASIRQVSEYEQVSAAIEDVITAIQFQDITRQQVEHVMDALKRIRGEPVPNVRPVLKLQSSQLSNAGQVFASSVGRIDRALGSIAERVGNMAHMSTTLMSTSADEHDSFFVQMEGHFTAILKIVAACDESESETHAMLARLDGTVAQMRVSVADVREIEIRIRGVAINAMIRAAEIGAPGKALKVIAEVMQGLGRDSSGITKEVAGALDTITGAAGRLSGADGLGWTPAGERSEVDSLPAEMRTAILEVRSSDESSSSRLTEIAALSSRLGREIQSVQAGFSAGRVFAEAIHRGCRALNQISGEASLRTLAETGEPQLEEFAMHYTMEGERAVHQSIATGAAVRAHLDEVPNVAAQADALGDNVELF